MKEKAPLIDLIIHDLTGPLSIVSTSVEGLLKKRDRYGEIPEKQRKTLERVLRNSNKAQRLLQEMIEVYRAEEELFRREYFTIAEILREALAGAIEVIDPEEGDILATARSYDEFIHLLAQYGLNVEVTGRYGKEPFLHDPKKVEQIIRNLISNALKYRKQYVKITISGDDDLIITVEDDGAGIPKEKQDYIFKRFFHVEDKPEIDIQKGLGFGLSCVKTLIETMDGAISVFSGEGQGTCFTIRIPSFEPQCPKEDTK